MTVSINDERSYRLTLRRDLDFALMTAALICKVIQYHKSLPSLEIETELLLGAFIYS